MSQPFQESERDLWQCADEADAMAKLVSYGPDRARLEDQARRLRQRALEISQEARSWGPLARSSS
jgi:hypothetical protein